MLIGEFQHNIDAKGRVFIPAKLREDLGERFVATKGLDDCISLYSLPIWKGIEERIQAQPMSKARSVQRFMFASAVEVEIDAQGRVVLPQNLREHAHLAKEAVIIGASNRAEIWNKERWNSACGELTSDAIAEAMDDLGF